MFDRFRALSPAAQLQLIVAGVCAIAVLLAAVWFFVLRVSYQPLFSDLRAGDAAAIVSALDRKKIPYRLAQGGTVILVPEDMVDSTRLNVMTDDIPLKGTVGFELFNKSDMGLTDFAQKINYQRALQGELERTIMTLDGVDTARVHLSLGEDRLFRDDRVPPKASVTVRMIRNHRLSPDAVQGVRRLVAAAIPNLEIADVVVLDEEGDVVSAPPAPAAANIDTPALEEKRAVEEYYEARIREALDRAGLAANIGVAVLAAADSTGGLSGWSPGTRDFPLQVTLSPAAPLEPAAQENVRAVAAGVIASSVAQADVVAFGTAPAAVSVPQAVRPPVLRDMRPPPLAADAAAPDDEHDVLLEAGLVLLVAVGFIAGLVFLARRLRGPRRLSMRRRVAFAAKLRAILDEGDGRAAS